MNRQLFSDHLEWAEGRRPFPYEDSVGKVTIGVGRNLDDRGLSDKEIDTLKENDMQIAIHQASLLPYWNELDDVRKVVIADMVFNLGIRRFKGFVRTNEALEQHDYERPPMKWSTRSGTDRPADAQGETSKSCEPVPIRGGNDMNNWQIFWRSIDEARLIVRLMVFIKLTLVAGYIFMVTVGLFDMVEAAMTKNMDFSQLAAVLGTITAFAGVTIPILANMYRDVWKDYRQSGTDWKQVGDG